MRKVSWLVISLFAMLLPVSSLQAQLFEDFESGSKSFYAGASVELGSGSWYMSDALIGNLGNDKFNGSFGARLDRRDGKQGAIYMEFDKPNGADELSFYMANYGSSSGNTVQVQYSIDQGTSWTNLGTEISATSDLEQVTLAVEKEENIRFKFIHASGSDRLNIDDILITDYITPKDSTAMVVTDAGKEVNPADSVYFDNTGIDKSREKTIQIMNVGVDTLVISEVKAVGSYFSISALTDSVLGFKETGTFTVTYAPTVEGWNSAEISITSNDSLFSQFSFYVAGQAFEESNVQPIADIRNLPLGSRVTVAGRVTVANEFTGPSFIQDNTAGIAIYWPALHTAVERGDSVVINGPLTEFNPIQGPEGDFLLQIGAHQGDNDISFEIIDTPPVPVQPTQITISQMNAGGFEAQLIEIPNVTIQHSGAFQGEKNYDISDATGTGAIRIDGNANLAGSTAPDEPVTIVGVVDQFNGTYQIKPRSTDDLGVEEVVYPGDDVSKDLTFEAVTWNIEWFGSSGNGPDDTALQMQNVKTVIDSIDADIYAFQEVSNTATFADLAAQLPDYGSIIASFSQAQRTAYLFKRATIDSLDSGLLSVGMTKSNWANGRYPLFFKFNASADGETREIYAYNIHAKAFDDMSSYNQRKSASEELKTYLDNTKSGKSVLFLGDYNDTTIGSITSGQDSPYKNFDDDPEYTIITKNLEQQGLASQRIGSFIDHITVSSELASTHIAGSERVENTSYIGSYLSTTSDHFPIWTRFQFTGLVNSKEEFASTPKQFSLEQNYPNPFNPSTVISYKLAESTKVTLEVFDVMGRKVATLVDRNQTQGSQNVTFDAAGLSSGVYIYRLSTSAGQQLTKKMMLIK